MRFLSALLMSLLFVACAKGGGGEGMPDATGNTGESDASTDAAISPMCNDLPCDAIYVSRSGNDGAPGSKEAPVATIQAAINKAKASNPKKAVFVGAGTYNEQIVMAPGVSVYGGFEPNWMRGTTATIIKGAPPAVKFKDINEKTSLDQVTVTSTDAQNAGESSFALLLENAKQIELRAVIARPGLGANGINGFDGVRGADGGPGQVGIAGCEDGGLFCSGCDQPTGQAGGTSSCGRVGGAGGNAGRASNAGADGQPGSGGASGGARGLGDGRRGGEGNGGVGTPGANGTNGMNGVGGGEVGMFVGSTYVAANGTPGTSGSNGEGGGGGGGGGGGTADCNSYGSSGGGGGGGGCAGTAAMNGTGAGGSFGLIALDSQVVVKASMIFGGSGGRGGNGGSGGGAGIGGEPGAGGPYGGGSEQDDGGDGGAGGRGGGGGAGGHAGGGGGGPGVAMVCLGSTTATIPQSTLTPGIGGDGGGGPLPGAKGAASLAIGCSFF